jgi:ribosomal protein S18 acetylase RimI-like enzyme
MTEITDEIFQAFQHLIPQLTEHSLPPTREALAVMASSAASIVFLARHPDMKGEIVGSATLGTFQTPTGIHGWIEDVVVDRDARRQGLGKALTEACLSKAQEIGLREVYLTSRPGRKAANQLYQSMGFIQRKTNVYRYEFA